MEGKLDEPLEPGKATEKPKKVLTPAQVEALEYGRLKLAEKRAGLLELPKDPLDEREALEWILRGGKPRSALERAFAELTPAQLLMEKRRLDQPPVVIPAPSTATNPTPPDSDEGTDKALGLIDDLLGGLVARGREGLYPGGVCPTCSQRVETTGLPTPDSPSS